MTIDILLGAGLLGLIGTLLTLYFTRGKTAAEVEKLIAETERIRMDTIGDIQKQLDELRVANTELHEARIRQRGELDRLHEEVELLRQELQSERSRNIKLTDELERQRNANADKTVQIVELRAQVDAHAQKLARFTSELTEVQRKTGQLHLRARDGE